MEKNSILVVGKAKDLLNEVEFRLLSEGFSVTHVDSGLKALEIMRKSAPGLIISDVSMANSDGFELCRKVRQESLWIDIPFIFISAQGSTDDRLMGFELGCDDYLSRPFEVDELIARINVKLNYVSRLERGSSIDQLTGILSRNGLESRLNNEVDRCQRYKRRFSLAKLDIGNLEVIREGHGDETCDEVLREFSEYISSNFRKVDILAHYSREQFVVIMPEVAKNHSMVPLERVRQGFENTPLLTSHGVDINIQTYGGVAEFPGDGANAADIMSATDSALSVSKATGKSRVVMFQKG